MTDTNRKLSFLSRFGIELADNALTGFVSAIAKFDPKTASAADIALLEEDVQKAAKLKVEAALEVDGPEGLKAQIKLLDSQRNDAMQALTILQGQYTAAADDKKADIKRRASVVNHRIEVLDEQLERDRTSLVSADQWLQQTSEALQSAAELLGTAKQTLADAQRDMRQAAHERKAAETTVERQKVLAGIRGAGSNLGVALSTMKNAAADDRKAAAIARETGIAIGTASTSGMDEVHKILGQAKKPESADPFARLTPGAGGGGSPAQAA